MRRYVLRPPLANHRLRWLSDDELLLSPSELLARLAALVPPKGFNLTRYHGVLAPRSRKIPPVLRVSALVASPRIITRLA
jgi:hypothetical protein